MKFTGKIEGLERGAKFIVHRYIDARTTGYKQGFNRHCYTVTERGKDYVLASETTPVLIDHDVRIYNGVDIGGVTKLYR